MFTGIISDLGEVRSIERAGETRLVIATAYDVATIDLGASIACSGACLTVIDKGGDWLAFEVSDETLGCTTLGDWRAGARVNLERPLKAADELGGVNDPDAEFSRWLNEERQHAAITTPPPAA